MPTTGSSDPLPWPVPRDLQFGSGRLRLDQPCHLAGPWQFEVRAELGCLDLLPGEPVDRAQALLIQCVPDPAVPAGGYRLIVGTEGAVIHASGVAGARAGALTLHQLLPAQSWRAAGYRRADWSIPALRVADAPAHEYRGFLLDVARHFAGVPEVRDWIDLLAMHRMTHLHLHLTDDQGWRLPSHRLDLAAATRRSGTVISRSHRDATQSDPDCDNVPHGGCYSPADLTEIVAYAAGRGITIVPELDLPGHASALLHAAPQLGVPGAPRPEVACRWGVFDNLVSPLPDALAVIGELLAEVAGWFPGELLHIGGDEVPLASWERSAQVVQYAREFGGIAALRAHVTAHLARTVVQLGRRPVAWDDAFTAGGLPTESVVMAWHDEQVGRAAAAAGYDVILAPVLPTYLDYSETADPDEHPAINSVNGGDPLPSATVAAWAPAASAASRAAGHHGSRTGRIIGAQAQLWTEHLPTQAAREHRALPRLSLLAGSFWSGSPMGWPDPPGFADQLHRLAARHVNFAPPRGAANPGGSGAWLGWG